MLEIDFDGTYSDEELKASVFEAWHKKHAQEIEWSLDNNSSIVNKDVELQEGSWQDKLNIHTINLKLLPSYVSDTVKSIKIQHRGLHLEPTEEEVGGIKIQGDDIEVAHIWIEVEFKISKRSKKSYGFSVIKHLSVGDRMCINDLNSLTFNSTLSPDIVLFELKGIDIGNKSVVIGPPTSNSED